MDLKRWKDMIPWNGIFIVKSCMHLVLSHGQVMVCKQPALIQVDQLASMTINFIKLCKLGIINFHAQKYMLVT